MIDLFSKMKDSLINEQTQKACLKREFQYMYEKKVIADSIGTLEKKINSYCSLYIKNTNHISTIKKDTNNRLDLSNLGFCG